MIDENEFELLVAQAQNYLERGLYDEALIICNRALLLDKNNLDLLEFKATVLGLLDKLDESLEVCNKILSLDESHKGIISTKAHIYYQMKEFGEAADLYADAIEYNPSAANYFMYANSLERNMMFTEAIDAFKEAIRLRPNYAEAYLYLGRTYYFINHNDDAKKALTKATEYAQGNPEEEGINDDVNEILAWIKKRLEREK